MYYILCIFGYVACTKSHPPKPFTGENRDSVPVLMINAHASIRGHMHLAAVTLARSWRLHITLLIVGKKKEFCHDSVE